MQRRHATFYAYKAAENLDFVDNPNEYRYGTKIASLEISVLLFRVVAHTNQQVASDDNKAIVKRQ